MTDRELLELAAKAAGYKIYGWEYGSAVAKIPNQAGTGSAGWLWNPLTDDGDALRLAVKLRISLEFTKALGAAWKDEFVQASPSGKGHLAASGPLDTSDPYAATRRAIVMAAAEAGKAMER